MKLGEIINKSYWLSVQLILEKLYPQENENIANYKACFETLKTITSIDSSIELIIEEEFESELDTYGVGHVYGIDHKSTNKITKAVALGFTGWNAWLGMTLNEISLREFTEFEIICHCLIEMMCYGFTEDEIQEVKNSLNQKIEIYKNNKD